MSADPEGDSEMLSSSPDTSSELSNPQTPTTTFHAHGHGHGHNNGPSSSSAAPTFPASSELSPPGSQDATTTTTTNTNTMGAEDGMTMDYTQTTTTGNEGFLTSGVLAAEGVGVGVGAALPIALAEPGASWNNKKAEEEYQRAMEYVVDLDFSINEFGDPFDDRDIDENLPQSLRK
ncbi:hypothetical protein AJ80_09169 [Polytolypa hystricis UAMH7299]|uniref:Uncharacterized protein n=1 Tax=Polytolypa hystricis (strain UAMH7299) TaxID=1447883 RepID=A0A2B7WVK1_POLH7|nr:hypothetical protein AJ80_09169 [Polytolypa hystricis UAMH7299]